jgi:hypothetical protein
VETGLKVEYSLQMKNGVAEHLKAHLQANRCAEVDMARQLSYHRDERRISEKWRENLGVGILGGSLEAK